MSQQQTEETNELYEHFRFVVDKGQSQLRIDKFLMLRIENASRNKIQNAAKAGNILVNNKLAMDVCQTTKTLPEDFIFILG